MTQHRYTATYAQFNEWRNHGLNEIAFPSDPQGDPYELALGAYGKYASHIY